MDTELKNDGFLLYDTQMDVPYDMRVYRRKCDVGNSYNANVRYGKEPSWVKQSRFVAAPIRIIDANTGETFT